MNELTAKDLMVGDWVCYKGKELMPCRVYTIVGNSIRFDNGTPQDWMSDVKNFEPIPLTAEILEKNGWSYNNEDAKYAAETWVGNGLMLQENGVGYRIVVVSDYDDEDTNDTQFVITYIHELQHALRLCGIDKEIKL